MALTRSLAARTALARSALALLLVGSAALGLAGCGSSDSEYCKLVEQNKQTLVDLSTNVNTLTAGTVTKLRSIEAAAPSDVKDDWKQFNDYLQAVVDRDETTLKAKSDSMVSVGANIDKSLSQDCRITMPSS